MKKQLTTKIVKIEKDEKTGQVIWIAEQTGYPLFTEDEIRYWGMKYWPCLFGIKELTV